MDQKKSLIINNSLKAMNFTLAELKQSLQKRYFDATNIVIYMSSLEGLGTSNSDVDVYVIECNTMHMGNVIQIQINGVVLDVELWDSNNILQIYNEVSQNTLKMQDVPNMKLLLRLRQGLWLNSDNKSKLLETLKETKLESNVTNMYADMARSHYDDARKMIKSGETILSLDEMRRAAWLAAAALNSIYGHPNLKEKWITKIFLDSNVSSDLKERYLNLQVYSTVNQKNINKIVSDFSDLVSDMFFEIVMENG